MSARVTRLSAVKRVSCECVTWHVDVRRARRLLVNDVSLAALTLVVFSPRKRSARRGHYHRVRRAAKEAIDDVVVVQDGTLAVSARVRDAV